MSEQLLPIDTELSAQLARRAGGRLPDGLLSDVMQAVDAAQDRPAAWHRPRFAWRTPQFALGAASTGFAAVLVAVLVIAPFVQSRPAGPAYPADRALSTAEFAKLMAGPALATNTAIVADVTIDANPDVCPMNRYPTLGVVEAMGSQVCVMQGGVYTSLTGSKWTGTFAFRYLGPGILGLLGQVNAASGSKLAYGATDQWPLAGKVFLVDGWLGSSGLCEASKWVDPEPGDVLNPTGPEPCAESWISDKSAPYAYRNYRNAAISTPTSTAPIRSLSPDDNQLAQVEDLYWVGAGGMRAYDNLSGKFTQPVHGTWAVKSSVGPCPNDPPISSRGCGFWLVLARIPDLTTSVVPSTSPPESSSSAAPVTPIPEPTTPATPTATPLAGLPIQRAMTTAEFAAVMAGPAPATGTTFIATVTMDRKGCDLDNVAYDVVILGMGRLVCVNGGTLTLPKITGTFALRFLGPGLVQNIGQVEPASTCRLIHEPTDNWPWVPPAYHTFLVGGYLVNRPEGWMILTDPKAAVRYQGLILDTDAGFSSIDPSRYGVFVVTSEWVSVPASTMGPPGDGVAYHVRAWVADVSGAAAVPSAPSSVCGPAPSI